MLQRSPQCVLQALSKIETSATKLNPAEGILKQIWEYCGGGREGSELRRIVFALFSFFSPTVEFKKIQRGKE